MLNFVYWSFSAALTVIVQLSRPFAFDLSLDVPSKQWVMSMMVLTCYSNYKIIGIDNQYSEWCTKKQEDSFFKTYDKIINKTLLMNGRTK